MARAGLSGYLIRKPGAGKWVSGLLVPGSKCHVHLHWFESPAEAPHVNIRTQTR